MGWRQLGWAGGLLRGRGNVLYLEGLGYTGVQMCVSKFSSTLKIGVFHMFKRKKIVIFKLT